MPSKRTKKSELKQWWTVAHFTREGAPALPGDFVQRYQSERVLLEDLTYGMKNFYGPRGLYAAMAWQGQVTKHEALNTKAPKFTVYEDGSVHVHT
jgi:hypothetical protein